MINNSTELGAAVRAARKSRGLTQVELAVQAGVARAWLAKFEAGHPTASIEQVFRTLRALGLGLDVVEPTYTEAELRIMAARDRRKAARTHG